MQKTKTNDNNSIFNVNYGIQIVFSTTPNEKKMQFEKEIEKNHFEDFRSKHSASSKFLYKPLKFFVLGEYDVCYITLINNFKFSHRVFENLENSKASSHHTFKSYSGFALNEKGDLESLFSEGVKEKYVGVYNLKINNALLLGNGLDFVIAIKKHLENDVLINIPYILMQTFSWFELSLIFFTNKIEDFEDVLKKIRRSIFIELEDNKKLSNSFYHKLIKKSNITLRDIENASLFSDTFSYFGFNRSLIEKNVEIEDDKTDNRKLQAEIEWHVKPGHIKHLQSLLNEQGYNNDGRIVFGKSDYITQVTDLNFIIKLIRELRKYPKKYFAHIRKVRSYVFFKYKYSNEEGRDVIDLEKILFKLSFKQHVLVDVKNNLKKLKISRALRNRVIKSFTNYNHGIIDPILFPYFLDFKVFLENIVKFLDENSNVNKLLQVDFLEKQLTKRMEAFKDGFHARFLNGYLFESMSTFSIDYNSSIQLLLTSYNTMVFEYGKQFHKQGFYYPIIQLNVRDTKSNYLSINYSVHHLTSPEFVFSTVNKEIINSLKYQNRQGQPLYNQKDINAIIEKVVKNVNDTYFDDLYEKGLFDVDYLIADILRFVINYDLDFNLFYYWFWSYNFQNAALFDNTGMINEDRLKMELLRIWLIKEIFQINNIKGVIKRGGALICPAPEMKSYWLRHEKKIGFVAKEINTRIFANKEGNSIKTFINNILNVFFKDFTGFKDNKNNYPEFITTNLQHKISSRKLAYTKWDKKINSNNDLQYFFIMSLRDLMNMNNGVIKTVKRDWKNGTYLDSYKVCYKGVCYAIDAFGGMYFVDENNATEYFIKNAEILLKILNFSYTKKIDFIMEKI